MIECYTVAEMAEDYGPDIDVPDTIPEVEEDFDEYRQTPFLHLVPESVEPVVEDMADRGYQEDEGATDRPGRDWDELERFRAQFEALNSVRYGVL